MRHGRDERVEYLTKLVDILLFPDLRGVCTELKA
jgi:hypothetical protein